jgi:tight adherence protein C
MLTQEFLIGFYIVSALIVVAMVWRMRRRRLARPSTAQPPVAPEPAPMTATEEVVEPTEQRLLYPAAESLARRSEHLVDRPLFPLEKKDGFDRLPVLRAGELPVAGEGDLVFGPVTPAFAAMLPVTGSGTEETLQELQQAGYYEPHAIENFAAVRYALVMAAVVLAGGLVVLAPPRVEGYAVGGLIILPLLAWALPRLYLRGKARDRRSEIERAMPDLLDLMNMCVSQGLTIPDALNRVLGDLRPIYPALAQELRIVGEQTRVGSLEIALQNFSRRIDVPEVHSFTGLLTQTERMGTSVSEALASYSDTMRESLRQRADEKGNRATFRLLFPTVLCLMPAVYLFLLGPAVVQLSDFYNSGGRDAIDSGTEAIMEINQRNNTGR